jgi:hypothetical protein
MYGNIIVEKEIAVNEDLVKLQKV